jgi:DNA repair exonuclease SbcCD nuclease subunit
VDTCIIGGDLVDNNALSPFEKQQGITLVDEIESAQQLIRMLARSFKKVLFIAGNHDLRVTKKLDWAIPLQNDLEKFIEADVDNATASDYRWMELRNGGETYRIVHPKNSSVNSPLVPRKLASKYHCHIVGGHGHTVGLSRDDSNWYWAIDAGVTNDPRKISYVTKEMSIRPMVMQGAVLILDGIPVLLTPQNILLYES